MASPFNSWKWKWVALAAALTALTWLFSPSTRASESVTATVVTVPVWLLPVLALVTAVMTGIVSPFITAWLNRTAATRSEEAAVRRAQETRKLILDNTEQTARISAKTIEIAVSVDGAVSRLAAANEAVLVALKEKLAAEKDLAVTAARTEERAIATGDAAKLAADTRSEAGRVQEVSDARAEGVREGASMATPTPVKGAP